MPALQTPYEAQDPAEIKTLVETLERYVNQKKPKPPFGITHRSYDLPTGRSIDRWKIREFDYHKPNLPVYARGFFTYRTQDDQYEIAARGYDKFFNLGEAEVKTWAQLQTKTTGPYELSVKENGCIIFMSGLDDGTLLVCSKNSTGDVASVTTASEMSHSVWGEKWVERHLRAAGKTKEALARELRRMNATAVAELCDDEFEEHVLPYSGDRAGLYMHGINLNLPRFVTYPGPLVDEFANKWGFKKVDYISKDTIQEVEEFLTKAAETGTFDGRDTEGFVIRCKAKDEKTGTYGDFFFKYKFEEPYLLYRQWRELTRSALHGNAPKINKNKEITRKYLEYAMRRLETEPGLKESYGKNQGIISLRQDFLDAHRLTGMDVVRQERAGEGKDGVDNDEPMDGSETAKKARTLAPKVVVVPVATIGCGKTTVAIALSRLFGWGHVQNDDVTSKKDRFRTFTARVRSSFASANVCIADRNNHMRRERKQIFEEMPPYPGAYSFICLHYLHPPDQRTRIFQDTKARITERGDNHQTIRSASSDKDQTDSIMWGFLNRFEPVDVNAPPDREFSLVIDLDPQANSIANLEKTITEMFTAYPSLFPNGIPKKAEMENAIHWALHEYTPAVKAPPPQGQQSKAKPNGGNQSSGANGGDKQGTAKASKPPLEYFAIRVPPTDVNSILSRTFEDADDNVRAVYDQLVRYGRVQKEFHVTLIHRSAANAREHSGYWQDLLNLHRPHWTRAVESGNRTAEPELGSARVLVERVIWNHRLMCLVVRILPGGDEGERKVQMANGGSANGADGAAKDEGAPSKVEFRSTNRVAHITIGTMNPSIKPKESNDLLARWLDEVPEPEGGQRWEIGMKGEVVLEGSVRGVLSRFR